MILYVLSLWPCFPDRLGVRSGEKSSSDMTREEGMDPKDDECSVKNECPLSFCPLRPELKKNVEGWETWK